MNSARIYACCLLLSLFCCGLTAEDDWPQLPALDGTVNLPAQDWPQQPGLRHVRVLIHYPQGDLAAVNEQTGLMLSLHNWGGEDCVGTADPQVLANRLNVVAICVNYLQSGRQAQSPNFLSVDAQEIRFVAHPQHLTTRQRLGSRTKIVVMHGVDDHTCPIEDARELVANMQAAEVDVEPHFISEADLDGAVFTSTGHSLGNRTEIVLRVAGQYLTPGSEQLLRREGKSDFELQQEVRYATSTGEFVISYAAGFPVGRFESGLAAGN